MLISGFIRILQKICATNENYLIRISFPSFWKKIELKKTTWLLGLSAGSFGLCNRLDRPRGFRLLATSEGMSSRAPKKPRICHGTR